MMDLTTKAALVALHEFNYSDIDGGVSVSDSKEIINPDGSIYYQVTLSWDNDGFETAQSFKYEREYIEKYDEEEIRIK